MNKLSNLYVCCIQAIEKRVRVLKNVDFDHWLWFLCLELWKITSRFWK